MLTAQALQEIPQDNIPGPVAAAVFAVLVITLAVRYMGRANDRDHGRS